MASPVTLGSEWQEQTAPLQFSRGVFEIIRSGDSLLADKSSQVFKAHPPRKKRSQAHATAIKGFRDFLRAVEGRERAARLQRRTQLELNWLREHAVEYAGRWVALIGDNLIAVADTSREAYRAAGNRDEPILVTRVAGAEPPFAGW